MKIGTSGNWPRALFAVALAATAASCAHTGGLRRARTSEPSLSGATWRIYDMGTGALVGASKTELRIEPDGKVSGSTGCNRFTGTATVVGTSITFSPLATARMICEPALMSQEAGILSALQSAKSFALVGEDRLNLLGSDGQPLLRLVRAKP